MQFISSFCSVVAVVSALLLIIVVLIQDNKSGGGLGGLMGGNDAMFGGETATVMVKITTWLAIIFLIATLAKASILGHVGVSNSSSMFATPVTEAAAEAAPTAEAAPVAEVAEAAPEAAPAAEAAAAPEAPVAD